LEAGIKGGVRNERGLIGGNGRKYIYIILIRIRRRTESTETVP
jgi:hypothetical protein